MSDSMWTGVVMVVVAGLFVGGGGWPIKLFRKYKYEQWGFLGNLITLVAIPWLVTMIGCGGWSKMIAVIGDLVSQPDSLRAVLLGNLIAMGWGVANVLCSLCFVRIGFALTAGILTGLGMSTGVLLPLIFKGSGIFGKSPDITSKPGQVIVAAVMVMLVAVLLVVLAGLGKDRALKKADMKSGGRLENPIDFYTGLTMAVVMGILSCGLALSFVYSQGPISETMKSHGATEWSIGFASLAMGALVAVWMNVLYPAFLMIKNRSWGVLTQSPFDFFLIIVMGLQGIFSFPLMFIGMKYLGSIGASVGFGIQQSMQMIGSQLVGFISGEWHGVHGRPRVQMYLAIAVLIVAVVILAYGKHLAQKMGLST